METTQSREHWPCLNLLGDSPLLWGSQGRNSQEPVIPACNNRERITSSLVLSLTPCTVQELLPRECVTYGGLDFPSQLIKTILSGPPTDQPNVDNLSVTPSFQVVLGCIELAIKANYHILYNDCTKSPQIAWCETKISSVTMAEVRSQTGGSSGSSVGEEPSTLSLFHWLQFPQSVARNSNLALHFHMASSMASFFLFSFF